jgi:hypothetical protein
MLQQCGEVSGRTTGTRIGLDHRRGAWSSGLRLMDLFGAPYAAGGSWDLLFSALTAFM